MNELKDLCNFVLNEERMDIKCFQTDKALTYLDFLRQHTQLAEEDSDLSLAYEYSQQLY